MKIVSVDIGIRNLAICVLEGTSRNDVKIIGWDVIDVIGEKNGVLRPSCMKCKKPAMWSCHEQYACSLHVPKSSVTTKTELNKKSIFELQKLGESLGIQKSKKPELVNSIYNHLRQGTWTKFKGNARGQGGAVLELDKDIVACLNKRSDWWTGADLCIFENQKDRRMFAVQAMLHMYFSCKGYKTQGISAIHKLENIMTIDDRTDSYRGRKKTGIVHCEALCPHDKMDFFQSHKKKDDLADAFLQGLWKLEH
ncbi:MAG: hypothetical protein EBU01_14730 [Crocinitomicaceae bacterium]|nr:hypothetical protein [Crocinitomicaceae bacterium]